MDELCLKLTDLNHMNCYRILPAHSDELQSWVSVELPGQVSLPPKDGSLQPRPLTLDPLPHVVEQWDHWPHDSHSAGMAAKLLDFIIEEDHQKWRYITIDDTWTLSWYALFCLCRISRTRVFRATATATATASPCSHPQAFPAWWSALRPPSPRLPFAFISWGAYINKARQINNQSREERAADLYIWLFLTDFFGQRTKQC